MTRMRSADNHDPTLPLMSIYYTQRACYSGTLLVTEATCISPRAAGCPNVPGIWSQSQISAWKTITDSVHSQGSFIFCQLWALGRTAEPSFLQNLEGGPYDLTSSSATPLDDKSPRELSVWEIKGFVNDYVQAAKNAVAAGFDGIEIHAANGYLIDQFTQDTCNKRSDEYGGSIESRSRFCVEVAAAVCEAIGAGRVGIRFSPFSSFQGMGMVDPIPQFTHLLSELAKLKLAYIHICEARVAGDKESSSEGNVKFIFDVWGHTSPIFLAGGFGPAPRWESASAAHAVDEEYQEYDVGVVFARHFLSNPDLVNRIKNGVALSASDPATFYKTKSPDGYIDYTYSKEWQAEFGPGIGFEGEANGAAIGMNGVVEDSSQDIKQVRPQVEEVTGVIET